MRTVATLLLLCLALAGVSAGVRAVGMQSCAAADVLAVQTVADDDVDDVPWELPRTVPTVEARVAPVPEPSPARHVPRLDDRRRTRPPRA